jgi:hypothetical protein
MLGRMIKIFFFLNFVKKAHYIKGVFFLLGRKIRMIIYTNLQRKPRKFMGGFFYAW